jgi:hypothetical protein
MKLPRLNLFVFALLAALFLSGCQSITLDPAGPYKGDVTLYKADLAIKQAYAITDAFLRYEEANRATVSESVRRMADEVREEAPIALGDAVAMRDVYATIKTSVPADRLAMSLAILQHLITRVSAHLPQPSNT